MDLTFLKGKRTYVVAVATVCYALGGMVAGYIELMTGINLILAALGLSGLRAGLQNFLQQFQIPQAPAQQ